MLYPTCLQSNKWDLLLDCQSTVLKYIQKILILINDVEKMWTPEHYTCGVIVDIIICCFDTLKAFHKIFGGSCRDFLRFSHNNIKVAGP